MKSTAMKKGNKRREKPYMKILMKIFTKDWRGETKSHLKDHQLKVQTIRISVKEEKEY